MFTVKMANLRIGIENRFPDAENLCLAYRTEPGDEAFFVRADETALEAERQASAEPHSCGYLETICLYRNIGTHLPLWNGFLFHAAVIELEGAAYAFAAPSGTGKSTHIALWHEVYGDAVRPVNGDKPIFRFWDGELYACGTPWAGKENWQRPVCVPLRGLCFLKRGGQNRIRCLTAQEALPMALPQMLLPRDAEITDRTLSLLDRLLRRVPLWELICTPTAEASVLAKNTMTTAKGYGQNQGNP